MSEIIIDGKKYNDHELSAEAKEQIASIKFVQSQIEKLEAEVSVYKTAAFAYSNALKKELKSEKE